MAVLELERLDVHTEPPEKPTGRAGIVTAATAAVVCAIVTWPSWRADFGQMDDHEPLRWIGRDGRLTPSEWWRAFYGGEVGDSDRLRFRPAYFLWRVGQAAVFGDHPLGWYASVLAMFVAAVGMLAWTVVWWFRAAGVWSWWVGPAAGFTLAGLQAWGGIVGRLGPSEQVAMLAASAVLLAATRLVLGARSRWWALLVIGVWFAVLGKETFVGFAALGVIVAIYRRGRWPLALCVAPVVLLAAMLGPSVGGGDVYGRPTGLERFDATLDAAASSDARMWALTFVLLVVAAITAAPRLAARDRRLMWALVALACVTVIGDAWINAGDYTTFRYQAVINLVTVLQLAGAICLAIIGRVRAAVWLTCGALLLVAPMIVMHLKDTRHLAAQNAAVTSAYRSQLERIVDEIDQHPDRPVAVVTVYDAPEQTLGALTEMHRLAAVDHDQFLIVVVPGKVPALAAIAERGDETWAIRPINELKGDTAICVHLHLNPSVPTAGCDPSLSLPLDVF